MKGKVVEYGGDLAIVIEAPLPDELAFAPGTQLDIASDGNTLIITTVEEDVSETEFEASLEKVNRHYPNALKRLAN